MVAPCGELDLATVEPLRKALLEATAAAVRLLVVDLAAVRFMDSTALGVLVAAARRMREQGGELQVINVHGVPRRVLHITGLDQHLPTYPL